jgi:hypothetical protein
MIVVPRRWRRRWRRWGIEELVRTIEECRRATKGAIFVC